jgi:hypothetical protein
MGRSRVGAEATMPRVTTVGPEARARLIGQGRGYDERAPYREAIASLSDDQLIELEPDPNETLRQVRARTRRAAKEVGRHIAVGETTGGTLLVWLAEPARRRRPRPSAREQQREGAASPTPQEELPP